MGTVWEHPCRHPGSSAVRRCIVCPCPEQARRGRSPLSCGACPLVQLTDNPPVVVLIPTRSIRPLAALATCGLPDRCGTFWLRHRCDNGVAVRADLATSMWQRCSLNSISATSMLVRSLGARHGCGNDVVRDGPAGLETGVGVRDGACGLDSRFCL